MMGLTSVNAPSLAFTLWPLPQTEAVHRHGTQGQHAVPHVGGQGTTPEQAQVARNGLHGSREIRGPMDQMLKNLNSWTDFGWEGFWWWAQLLFMMNDQPCLCMFFWPPKSPRRGWRVKTCWAHEMTQLQWSGDAAGLDASFAPGSQLQLLGQISWPSSNQRHQSWVPSLASTLGVATLVRALQPRKTSSSIWVKEFEMVTHTKRWQSLKAPRLIWVTEFGMATLVKEQPEKAHSPISLTESGIARLIRALQPRKTSSSIWVKEFEMVTHTKRWQSLKAPRLIWVTEFGMATLVKEQPAKAQSQICLTESGIATLVRALQPRNASSPMWVTEFGMVTHTKRWQSLKTPRAIRVTEFGMATLVKEQPAKA